LNETQWAITFLDMADDVPLMQVKSNFGNADITVEEVVVPKYYKLDAVLNGPLGYYPSRGFKVDPS
jgi:hypothetical protein